MKLLIFMLLQLTFFNVNAAEDFADVVLNAKNIRLSTHETTLVRTSSTPRKVTITAPEWRAQSICQDYDYRRVSYPCNGPCFRDVVCSGVGRNRQCRTIYRCTRNICNRTEQYCVRYASVPVKHEKTVKLVFKSPKKLKPGHEEKYFFTTASRETVNSRPHLEAENASCHDITKRRGGKRFVVRLNKECE